MSAGGSTRATAAKAAPTPRGRALGPSARTRSVWLTQLVLAGSVVAITAVVQVLSPEEFMSWTYTAGVGIIIAYTAVALLVPWQRLPRDLVLILPFGDIVGIGLMVAQSELQFGFLWVFPIFWIATHFSLGAVISALVAIAAIIVGEAAVLPSSNSVAVRLIIVMLSLTFIGLMSWQASRQTRAFKQLLRRQANRQQDTIARVSSQERRVSQMLNALDVGIARFAIDGGVLAINDTFARLYGLDRNDPSRPGRAVVYDSFRGEPLAAAFRPMSRAARGDIFDDERVWLFDGEGNWHALSVSSRLLDDLGSEAPSILLVVHDITDLIESERVRERLATVVSHELRNPLTAILGHAELALDDEELPDSAREQLEVIDHAGQRMQTLIGEILTMSRAKDSEDRHARVDLRRILEGSLESFGPSAKSQGVRVQLRIDDELPVWADAFRLRQVTDNLISNAIKYTSREGTVRVRGVIDDGAVVVTIADNGIGIAPEDLPQIFDPYFRAGTARDSPVPGTGLGLGIARDIIIEHDGVLDIESQPAVGTTVTIRLPAEEPTRDPDGSEDAA